MSRKILLILLSILSLSQISVGKFITRFTDSDVHPCERLNAPDIWAHNPRGCDLYYYCEQYPEYIGSGRCPDGFHFHEASQACVEIEVAECTIDDDLWGAKCDGKNAFKVGHPFSCNEFTVCIDDLQADFQCAEGLHFSPYDQECVDPSIANCRVTNNTCPDNNIDYIPKLLQNSRNCGAYYLCFNGNLQRFECGPEQIFDSKNSKCMKEEDADCDVDSALPGDLDIPSQLTLDCTPFVNGTRVPHPEACRFWFWCINDRSQLFWCGEGTLFDSVTRTCKVASSAICVNDVTDAPETTDEPTEETTTEEETDDTTPTEEEDTTLEAETDDPESFLLNQMIDTQQNENELPMNFV